MARHSRTEPASPATSSFAMHSPSGRLGQGELRRQVAEHLVANPGSHTAGEIARALGGRSSGAVANALTTLVERGQAEQNGGRPRRFRANATTTDALRGSTPIPTRASVARERSGGIYVHVDADPDKLERLLVEVNNGGERVYTPENLRGQVPQWNASEPGGGAGRAQRSRPLIDDAGRRDQ